jgi:hypothetical protein
VSAAYYSLPHQMLLCRVLVISAKCSHSASLTSYSSHILRVHLFPCFCSVRRSSHTRSAPALTNNAAGGRRRVLSGISEDMAEPSSIGSAAERYVMRNAMLLPSCFCPFPFYQRHQHCIVTVEWPSDSQSPLLPDLNQRVRAAEMVQPFAKRGVDCACALLSAALTVCQLLPYQLL